MLKTAASRTPEISLLHALNAAIDAFATFAPEHVRCADCVRRLLERLEAVHAMHPAGIAIARIERGFAVNELRIVSRDCGLVQLEERFQAMGINLLGLAPGIAREELRVLLQVLVRRLRDGVLADLAHDLAKAGLAHVSVCTETAGAAAAGAAAATAAARPPVKAAARDAWPLARHSETTLYWRAIERTRSLCTMIRLGQIPNAYGIRDAVESFLPVLRGDRNALLPAVFMPQEGDWEFSHAVRSAILALRIGAELTDDETSLRLLGESAFLHDIGLFAVPVQILHKEGPLTDDERAVIERHTIEGVRLLLTGGDFPPAAIEAALLHHSAQTPDGYPRLSETATPSTVAKIIRIADAYESIIGVRPYRRARSPLQAAAELIRDAGVSFDRAIVGRFIRTIGFFPAGSLVRLSDGSIAQVRAHDPSRMLAPAVSVLMDGEGRPVDPPRDIDPGAGGDAPLIAEGLACERETACAA